MNLRTWLFINAPHGVSNKRIVTKMQRNNFEIFSSHRFSVGLCSSPQRLPQRTKRKGRSRKWRSVFALQPGSVGRTPVCWIGKLVNNSLHFVRNVANVCVGPCSAGRLHACSSLMFQTISASSVVILGMKSMTTYWPEPSADTHLSSKLRYLFPAE